MNKGQKLGLYITTVSALLAVFYLYTRPDFLFSIANQVWACF